MRFGVFYKPAFLVITLPPVIENVALNPTYFPYLQTKCLPVLYLQKARASNYNKVKLLLGCKDIFIERLLRNNKNISFSSQKEMTTFILHMQVEGQKVSGCKLVQL